MRTACARNLGTISCTPCSAKTLLVPRECYGPLFQPDFWEGTLPHGSDSYDAWRDAQAAKYWDGSDASALHSGGGPSDGGASRHASRKRGPQRDEDLESSAESSVSESEGSASSAEQGDGWHSSGGRVRVL